MSDAYYLKIWLATQKDLEKVMKLDEALQGIEPIELRQDAIKKVLPVYYQYRRIVQRFTLCLDQIVQPQIREIVKKILDYSIVRMLEYRREMVNLAYIECSWPVEPLLDAKLTPDDIDLSGPNYDAGARLKEFERRKQIVEAAKSAKTSASKEELLEIEEEEPTEESIRANAVLLIQSHERARVSRVISIKAERKRKLDLEMASGYVSPKKIDVEIQIIAVTIIQRAWRNYCVRREKKLRDEQFEEIIGMTIPSWNPNKHIFERHEAIRDEQYESQDRALQYLHKAMEFLKEKMWERRGPALIEDIQDEIREWFYEWYSVVRYFDSIPPKEIGGSALIATGQARTPAEYLSAPAAAPKDDKAKAKGAKEDEELEDDIPEEEEEDEGWRMEESRVLPLLLEAKQEFDRTWKPRAEQLVNFKGGLFEDLITEELYYELQLEMRQVADQKMRLRLQELNRALAVDCKSDGQTFTPPAPETFDIEPKPTDEAAKRKEKEEGDRQAFAALEENLLPQLARLGVLRMESWPDSYRMSDWPGSPCVASRRSPEICLGDLKQPAMDYCVLPCASKIVHELAPLVRSVCICGPPNAGQIFLARAICTELKATVFDLTPGKHVGRFKGRDSQSKLLLAVNRLARAYAPSVILVEGEHAWLKKVPPEMHRVQPKRFAPIYKKIVNGIKPGDQVLFLTTSSQPHLAAKSFVRLHDKFIILPVSDYGTASRRYKNSLMRLHGVDRQLEISSLARLTHRESPLDLVSDVVARAASISRRMDLKGRPLKTEEIFEDWLLGPRPTSEELEQFNRFWSKMPLEVKRREVEEEENPPEPKDKRK